VIDGDTVAIDDVTIRSRTSTSRRPPLTLSGRACARARRQAPAGSTKSSATVIG
jgi:hypothetical protein